MDGLGHDTVGAVALDAQAGSVVYAIKQGQTVHLTAQNFNIDINKELLT